MATPMVSLRRAQSKDKDPPRILIYGPEKTGKTSLATEFPAPVFIQTEDGAGALDFDTFGLLTSFAEVQAAIGQLYDGPHEFQTVVIDSLSALEPLIWAAVCEQGDEKGKRSRIEDFGWGKGYKYAVDLWHELMEGIEALRKHCRMNVVLIAHSTTERFDDPETVSYTRYDIDLHEKACDYIKREVDAILLVKPDVAVKTEDTGFGKARAIGAGGRQVWIHATSRPAYVAGNRYHMPEKILYEPGKGYAALREYLPAQGE